MKMKFGAIVVDGRGKIGGHVASKNRSGAYLRTKVTPVNVRSTAQQNVRNIFGTIAQAWRGLTEVQRDAWNSAVGQWSKTDIFGDLRNPSGISLFQRLNANLMAIGESMIVSPPMPVALSAISCSILAVDNSSQSVTLTVTGTLAADEVLVVQATPALSAGINFVKAQLRRITYLSVLAAPEVLTVPYLAKFGSVGAAGQKITIQAFVVSTVTGQAAVPSAIAAVIAV
jgi:hypothetical protein